MGSIYFRINEVISQNGVALYKNNAIFFFLNPNSCFLTRRFITDLFRTELSIESKLGVQTQTFSHEPLGDERNF